MFFRCRFIIAEKINLCFPIFLTIISHIKGQELFIHAEPASSLPKGVIGLSLSDQLYREVDQSRNLFATKVLYGITSHWSIACILSFSNHHGTSWPVDFIDHLQNSSGSIFSVKKIKRGIKYPYLMNGIYFYSKYRIYSLDNRNRHFRIALFGEASYINVPHDEAEPSLMDDTRGVGGGVIMTFLNKHFASSWTLGGIYPFSFSKDNPALHQFIDPAIITLKSAPAIQSSLSFGYLLYPRVYKNFRQTNWNLYLELIFKSYGRAKVLLNDQPVFSQSIFLSPSSYLEVHPGIQHIINSNLRLDFSVGWKWAGGSYVRYYPIISFGISRYFYPSIKKTKFNNAS
ncbi:MAG: hypothetical protein U0T81_11840 [Saprospiraceae bacterium]